MICNLDTEHFVAGEAAVKMSNVVTRGFKVDKAVWKQFPNRIIAMDTYAKNRYLERISAELQKVRQYYEIGRAACDNMSTVEKLGLGTYTKKNVYVLDFSGCFNLALSKLTGSSLALINDLLPTSSYDEYNRAIRIQEKLNTTKIMSLTPECIKYFAGIVREYQGNVQDIIFQQILETLHDIMGYVFIDYQRYLQETYNISIVLRSYTFFELIITTDEELKETDTNIITITYNSGEAVIKARLQPEEIIVL